jgi:hypothetical protein
MLKKPPDPIHIERYSPRASIILWIVLAGFIWVTIGLIFSFATHQGSDVLDAEANRLSKIAPAAGPPGNEPTDSNSRPATDTKSQ